jgi:hypothetical protein
VKPFIEASTGHAAKKQEHKPYMTTCAGQTYRQNSQSNNRTKKAAGLDRDATGRADGLEFLLDSDARFVLT